MTEERILQEGQGHEEPALIRLPRRREDVPDLEQPAIRQGGKPGQHFVRVMRPRERRFRREEEGTFRATDRAIAPRTSTQRLWRTVRRFAVGRTLSTEELEEQRLPKTKALAVFSSDALSSSAYATDEILIVLAAAGTGALTKSIPLSIVIAALIAIVTFSYRQTIKAYPNGGGAYIVARENLGDGAGLTAAASLAVDYVLTVAVSVAAGVLAITSAFPGLSSYAIELAVACVGLITLANLRGVRESGTIFALPTYGFIISFLVLIGVGLIRTFLNPGLRAPVPDTAIQPAVLSSLSAFLLLRAFASGCTALTGIEAISNGIPAFKKPESKNASTTLMYMAAILTTLFIGLTILAHRLGVQPSEDVSVPAQIGKTIFGASPIFYTIQAFTALILILAANTSYADFPRLASILARDRFLPHQFTFRGDRLAFSNGIVVLGVAASILLVVFKANTTRLIPLYAFGVFVSFTLSQTAMVFHWLRLREPGWRASIIVNALGAVTTGIVAIIVGATKFSHGAWISMLAMAFLALLFAAIHRHYRGVDQKLELAPGEQVHTATGRQTVIVPVDDINLAVLQTLEFARTLSAAVTAVHISDDFEASQRFRDNWDGTVLDVPLVTINSPYRSFTAPFLSYLDALAESDPHRVVTVVLPEYRTAFPWQRWLHNQSARRLRNELLERRNTVVVEVPYHLADERA